jgi:hypothetical protein
MAAKRKTNRKNVSGAGRTVRNEVSNAVATGEREADMKLKEMGLRGWNAKRVASVLVALIGVILLAMNVMQALWAVVGVILIYFGLRLYGLKV